MAGCPQSPSEYKFTQQSAFGLTLSWYSLPSYIGCPPSPTDIFSMSTLPSMTEWVWPYSTIAVHAIVFVFMWINLIALIHQLPSLTDWHFLNEYSALNDQVSMTLLNECLCLYVNKFLIWLRSYIDCPPSPTDIFSMSTVSSMTEWVWSYSTIAFGLTLYWYLYEWIFHLIAPIHRLPSLTDWHFLSFHRLIFSQWIHCP